MVCCDGACENLLPPTMKWTRLMRYKERLSVVQRISQKGVKIKGTVGLIKHEGLRYLPLKLDICKLGLHRYVLRVKGTGDISWIETSRSRPETLVRKINVRGFWMKNSLMGLGKTYFLLKNKSKGNMLFN